MKKFRGKALAALLSLALIASSLPVTLASASTKSVTGDFVSGDPDTIYLVNAKTTGFVNTPTTDPKSVFSISDKWDSVELETKDHQHQIDDAKIYSISHTSGDKLVKWDDLDSDSNVANLTLRNDSVNGKENLSLLYEGTYYDDNDNEVTVKAKATLTVYVVDEGADYLGVADGPADGDAVTGSSIDTDSMDDFSVTRNSEIKLGIYTAAQSSDAEVHWDNTATATTADVAAGETSAPADYQISVTTGSSDVHLGGNSGVEAAATGSVPAALTTYYAVVGRDFNNTASAVSGVCPAYSYKTNGAAGNVVFTAKKIVAGSDGNYKVSSDSDDKLTLKGKIAKTIDAGVEAYDTGVASPYTTIQKDSSNYLRTGTDSSTNQVKISSGYGVKFGATTAYGTTADTYDTVAGADITVAKVLDKASVAKISGTVTSLDISDSSNVATVDLDSGDVTVDDAKTGDITTANGSSVSVDGSDAKVGAIEADDAGAVVTVNGGTTGDITTDGTIVIDALDEEVPVVVGKISAGTAANAVAVNSEDSKVTISSITADAADSDITLTGDNISVGTVDFDSYNAALTLEDFNGTLATANTDNGSVTTTNDDEDNPTTATISNAATFDSISIGSDTTLGFGGNVEVADIDGDGTLLFKAGSLYVTDSASGVTLKLTDASLSSGMTVFKADSDLVDVDDMTPYGFTLTKTEGATTDTFKIDTLDFAGLQIDKSASDIAIGQTMTFTASAYPGGTAIPDGAHVVWSFDGDTDVFDVENTDNTATIKVLSVDPDFASVNKGTLTASLEDEDGYALDDYGTASVDVTAVKTPAVVSDTTADFTLAPGASYQFKITSSSAPTMTAGTAGVLDVTNVGVSGNDYFIKVTAAANAAGKQTGIYLNGTKLLVVTVAGTPSFTSDTTSAVKVAKGASYQYKITASAAPSFALGTAGVFNYTLVSQSGNNYFYKITAVGASGAQTGVYVNGTKVNVATVA